MIPATVARSIVEVLTTAEVSIGTGFLVSRDGLILTARHVGTGSSELLVRFCGNVDVRGILVEQGDGAADDWALYRVSDVPLGINPIPRGNLGNVATQVAWHSIGFAKIRGQNRGAFHGEVRTAGPNLDLYCQELIDRYYDEARGLSGGPCIIDGEAIALIVDVLYDTQSERIVTGQVHAIPLDRIKPRTVQLNLGGEPPLPWEYAISGSLQHLSRDDQLIAASAARLANPVVGPQLTRQIARRMINGGVLGVAAVLRQLSARLGRERSDEIVGLAESLWVNGTAAESMNERVRQEKCGALATNCDWSAQHHLHRAFAIDEQGPTPWDHIVVDAPPNEPFENAVLVKTFETLGQKFGLPAIDKADIQRLVRDLAPLTAFIVSPPREEIVNKLHGPFPDLVIIFMSRVLPSGNAPFLKSVDHAPTEAEEQQAAAQNRSARLLLPQRGFR